MKEYKFTPVSKTRGAVMLIKNIIWFTATFAGTLVILGADIAWQKYKQDKFFRDDREDNY